MGYRDSNWILNGRLDHDKWKEGVSGLKMTGTEAQSHK